MGLFGMLAGESVVLLENHACRGTDAQLRKPGKQHLISQIDAKTDAVAPGRKFHWYIMYIRH